MRSTKVIAIIAILFLFATVLSVGCVGEPQKGERAKMLDVQSTPVLEQSNEREIFMGYLAQVNDPNNIQWIYCFGWDGHLIFKSTVMGKTISATKSTEPYERVVDKDGSYEDYCYGKDFAGYVPGTNQLVNPSGMFGHDTPGVIWQDPQGNYYEWHNGPYFVSNVPLKFETPVISYQNLDVEVYDHATQIEDKLRSGESLNEEDLKWLSI